MEAIFFLFAFGFALVIAVAIKQSRRTRIAWEGTLRSIESYAYDFVFGGAPSTKAQLEGRTGSRFAFTGRLLKADGFVRNLFVADGALAATGTGGPGSG